MLVLLCMWIGILWEAFNAEKKNNEIMTKNVERLLLKVDIFYYYSKKLFVILIF